MIIQFLIKHFRTILDALIIAAIVVAFAVFDPFHLFNSKVNVRNTPVAVESIRQIGQLITAEYYGETIASLPQSETEPIDPDQIKEEVQALYKELLHDLDSLKKYIVPTSSIKVKEKNIEDRMWENFPWLTRNTRYIPMLNFLKDTIKARSHKEYKRKQILWEFYSSKQIKAGSLTIDKNFQLNNFYKYLSKIEKDKLKEIKNNIVYIGRGWVKAGIDFGTLKPEDISYNTSNKTIFIKNCDTRILDCDINPWFIPGKVKGYELIKEKGSFKNPFAEAVKVKKQCVENLRMQAIKSGILEQAHQNGKETLKNLFSLLTNSEIKEVVFTTDKFDRILEAVKADKEISDAEAILINNLVIKSLCCVDTAAYNDYRRQLSDLNDFCEQLQKFQYSGIPVNGYSLDLSSSLKNDTINPFQLKKAMAILSEEISDSIGMMNDMLRFMANYNLPESDFVDSCIASGILKLTKSKTEHKLASLAKIYRDSLYNTALQTCTQTLQNTGNRYVLWFKTCAEADSAKAQLFRHLLKTNPELQLRSE